MEVTCRGWESHFLHQMGFASISLMWDQRPGSLCAANLCLILLPLGSAKPVLCQRHQGYPWLLLKEKSYCWRKKGFTACDLLIESYWIIHPHVNIPIIIYPCSLLCSVSGRSRWHPMDCCTSCFFLPCTPPTLPTGRSQCCLGPCHQSCCPSVLGASGEERGQSWA